MRIYLLCAACRVNVCCTKPPPVGGSLYIEGIVFVEAELVEVFQTGAVIVRDPHPLRNAALTRRTPTPVIPGIQVDFRVAASTDVPHPAVVHLLSARNGYSGCIFHGEMGVN
jgi:hypothetical protein